MDAKDLANKTFMQLKKENAQLKEELNEVCDVLSSVLHEVTNGRMSKAYTDIGIIKGAINDVQEERDCEMVKEELEPYIAEIEQLKADKAELLKALNGVMNIVSVSNWVDGYHCNGDVACWWDFDEIAEVSELIQKHKTQ